MNRSQIENLYEINGLTDYQLENAEDIIKTHGINIKGTKGFDNLNDTYKQLFENFIVKFMNGLGLESRATLIPTGIYFVEHAEHLAKCEDEDDAYTVCGATIKAIDKEGEKSELHHYIFKGCKQLKIVRNEVSKYLRFEYKHQGRKEWLHVISATSWY